MIKNFGVLAALLLSGNAFAQATPSDPLKDICTNFLAQGAGSVGGDPQRLCTCLVSETQKRLTRQEMEIYNKAATSGQQPPPAIMEKVVGIATVCLTQAR
jgi:hypothetical protein